MTAYPTREERIDSRRRRSEDVPPYGAAADVPDVEFFAHHGAPVLFGKSHVRGHTRRIGGRRVAVRPHERQGEHDAGGHPLHPDNAVLDTKNAGNFYASVFDPEGNSGRGRHGYLLGPYATHQAAINALPAAKETARAGDARSPWYSFGTLRIKDREPGGPGVLNAHLPEHYTQAHADVNRAALGLAGQERESVGVATPGATVFDSVQAAHTVADENSRLDEEGWTYHVLPNPNGNGRAIVRVYDENHHYAGNL